MEWWSVERINALAGALGAIAAIAWPLLTLAVVLIFKKPILAFLSQVGEVEFPGGKVKRIVQQKLDEAGEAAKLTAPFEPPTADERVRARAVEQLLEGNLAVIRQEAETLASEYQYVRASLPPSGERTQKMEAVVAKMRTIGRAVYPLRHELASSSAPGKRLLAIAALQVVPDYDMLDWLADRVKAERPFVAYHALVALDLAAKDPSASANIAALRKALNSAESAKDFFAEDSSRMTVLQSLKRAIEGLAG